MNGMPSAFRIGDWTVFPLRNEMEGRGRVARLEPRVMQVLVELAANSGEVALRSDLLNRVWGTRAAVSDECLTRAVSLLRQAFSDSPRRATYIQTVPKNGYRLLLPAVPLAAAVPAQQRARPRVSLRRMLRAFLLGWRRRHNYRLVNQLR